MLALRVGDAIETLATISRATDEELSRRRKLPTTPLTRWSSTRMVRVRLGCVIVEVHCHQATPALPEGCATGEHWRYHEMIYSRIQSGDNSSPTLCRQAAPTETLCPLDLHHGSFSADSYLLNEWDFVSIDTLLTTSPITCARDCIHSLRLPY